eukprot:CAMPEP_0113823298 /NCGR_PEP_ID=MMETSP0328-20130328/2672_1 /TAXON_ID=39455 /ORGANISM="Alexandrium minutum" /LENGTH=100 /DNA_ID=CAMNT_0000791237 /DNA_START=88 /DNA_END=390 /DNA_ORIENTATION=- /assembly_acc=CAM_ASM_000350
MSALDFLNDEVKEAAKLRADLSSLDREATRKPPASWGAARANSRFSETAVVADEAGPQGGAQGGGAGPSLPFRIREVQMVPKAIGSTPIFSVAKPQLKTE